MRLVMCSGRCYGCSPATKALPRYAAAWQYVGHCHRALAAMQQVQAARSGCMQNARMCAVHGAALSAAQGLRQHHLESWLHHIAHTVITMLGGLRSQRLSWSP
jgi:hypothetical protein